MISKQSLVIARWEFLRFFKWKSQLLSWLIMLAISGGVMLWQYLIDDSHKVYQILVAPDLAWELRDEGQFKYHRESISPEALQQGQQTGSSWDAVVALEQGKPVIHTPTGAEWLERFDAQLQAAHHRWQASQFGLNAGQLDQLIETTQIERRYWDPGYKGDDPPEKIIAIVLLFLLFLSISSVLSIAMVSIGGEKQQRVTEQLLSIITPQQWMDGKILGYSASAMKTFLTAGLFALISMLVLDRLVAKDLSSLLPSIWFVLSVLPFLLAGMLLCATVLGAGAALIDDPMRSNKNNVLLLLAWLPLILTYLVIDNPSGWPLAFLSYFPLTSFAAMPVKMALVAAPWWQVLVSLLLLLVTLVWARRIAGRIFERGIQLYGKEPAWSQVLGWALRADRG